MSVQALFISLPPNKMSSCKESSCESSELKQ